MKTLNYTAPKMPTANIAVNKSRVKVYDKETDPKIFLANQTEFQIELFNPTTDSILAKITLNGNIISQGGLVLNPGQRVFLDRYLDVAKKFLFETYEVSNTEEVKAAIQKNGDFKVEFYKEAKPIEFKPLIKISVKKEKVLRQSDLFNGSTGGSIGYYDNTTTTNYSDSTINPLRSSFTPSSMSFMSMDALNNGPLTTMDSLTYNTESSRSRTKNIETGRVELGSKSDQEFVYVDKKFEWFPFHKVEYKVLPISQKINTVEELNVRRYCINCGAKLQKDHKFCGHCGTKV